MAATLAALDTVDAVDSVGGVLRVIGSDEEGF